MASKPEWLKVNFNKDAVDEVSSLMARLKLNTVCKAANCPNLGECYKKHTATFMILGNQCTRNCRFCNVVHGRPEPVDLDEPANLAKAAKTLGLKHVVITCVTRDDLPDGGAGQFAACIREIRKECPDTTVEVLISDMKGDRASLDIVIDAAPDVLNHNVETVKELYGKVRPEANYERSLDVLRYVKEKAPNMYTKTGIMVGLGETDQQVLSLMDDVLATGCDILTIGQYLRPSPAHVEMTEYVTPEKFAYYKKAGENKGFSYIASSPLVRSSYRAEEALRAQEVGKMIYVETGSADPYYNFALEYWLITEKKPEESVFLFWRTEPTLMIGKYQNPMEEIDMEYAKAKGIHIVRRMSGGGTIYTDMGGWQFTFITKSENKNISFKEYILPVIEALHSLGVEDAGFNGRNDLVIGGRKFSGNAQYIHGGYTLHHGSLLYDTDISQMVAATTVDPYKIISKSIKSVRDRVTNISEHLSEPVSAEEFKTLMVSRIMGADGRVYEPDMQEQERIREIAREKFNNKKAIFGASPKYSIVRTGRFAGGKMEFNICVVKGKISDISVSGDFFGTVEAEEFAQALKGCEYEREAVEKALLQMKGQVYKVTAAEMAGVIAAD